MSLNDAVLVPTTDDVAPNVAADLSTNAPEPAGPTQNVRSWLSIVCR